MFICLGPAAPYETSTLKGVERLETIDIAESDADVIYGSVKPPLLATPLDPFPLHWVRMRPGSLISGDYGADSLTWLTAQWTFPVPRSSFLMNGIT